MKIDDSKILMRQALHEIRSLRSEVNILRAQMFVVDAFHAALLGAPRSGGMAPDLAWEIERHLERSEQKMETAE